MDRHQQFNSAVFGLLDYYRSGNLTSLKSIYERAKLFSGNEKIDKFGFTNFRLALELSGHLETSETVNSLRWSFNGPVSPAIFCGKGYYLGIESFLKIVADEAEEGRTLSEAISTREGFVIYKDEIPEDFPAPIDLSRKLIAKIPKFSAIEAIVGGIESGSPDFDHASWEMYFFEEMKWKPLNQALRSGLVRSWDPKTNNKSLWFYNRAGGTLKINYPEWAFLLAAKKLNFKFQDLIYFGEDGIRVPSSFKLPRLILKQFVTLSKNVSVDWEISFNGVSKENITYCNDNLKSKGLIL